VLMNVLRKLAKSAWVSRAQQDVVPLKDTVYLGSTYHGYYVPKEGKVFTADNKKEGYVYKISAKELGAITYCATGVWNEKKTVKFYVPANSNYAGHSITNLQNTEDYIEAPVDKLANIMRELGHQQIDLLKIEIEGSEYTVIDDVLADKLDVKMILV
nr:hypothetical protein [Tanacetum cinerariifolium]